MRTICVSFVCCSCSWAQISIRLSYWEPQPNVQNCYLSHFHFHFFLFIPIVFLSSSLFFSFAYFDYSFWDFFFSFLLLFLFLLMLKNIFLIISLNVKISFVKPDYQVERFTIQCYKRLRTSVFLERL